MPQPDGPASPSIAAPRTDPHDGFEFFYRTHYQKLIKIALAVNGTVEEADEAVDQTMEEMLRRWGELRAPFAYARRAVVSNLIKRREREREGRRRMIRAYQLDIGAPQDDRLNAWEDKQWVLQLLESLPPVQRAVLALVVDGLNSTEIAELLGKSPAAIRKNLELGRRRLEKEQELLKTLDDDAGASVIPTRTSAAGKEVP